MGTIVVNPDADPLSHPDVPELLAADGEPSSHLIPTIPVVIEGTAHVITLPSRLGAAKSFTVGAARKVTGIPTNNARRINADLRRRTASFVATDQPFYYGLTQEEVEGGTAAIWPINVPLTVTHIEEIWIASANSAGSAISYIEECWSV